MSSTSIDSSARTVATWLDEGRPVAVACLVDVEGSAPLPQGATAYIADDGAVEGSLTGGCVESVVAAEAIRALEDGRARVLRFRAATEDAQLGGPVGLTCGGTVEVLVTALRGLDREAERASLEARLEGRPHATCRLLDGPHLGAVLHVEEVEPAAGTLAGPALLDRNAAQAARGLLRAGRTGVRRLGNDGAALGGDLRVHVTVRGEPPHLVAVGAVDFASALAPAARALGYRVTIVDHRAAFISSPRLAVAAEVVHGWPDRVLARAGLGERDAVVVLTHDPKVDVDALLVALRSEVGYVGALGSRRTTAERRGRLEAAGATRSELARVHGPCGLDIGATSAEETAVAILAELIAVRAGRDGSPLRSGTGPIRSERRPVWTTVSPSA